MTIYRPTTNTPVGTGLSNPTYAYDNNAGTSATGSASGLNNNTTDFAGFSSVTGVTALTVYANWGGSFTIAENPENPGEQAWGSYSLQYSYDGANWQVLEDSPYESLPTALPSRTHRGGGDHLARGFMFRNNSLNGTYAHLAPFGNYTYWGGMLALRDVGNNSWYGLYFYNGVMYMKKLA